MQQLIKPNPAIVRTWAILLLGAMLSLVITSCRKGNPHHEKPSIAVSILPQKYFLEKLSGDRFNITVMIPPGESPATYDPSPDQMVRLAGSSIYFLIGHIEFEKVWIRKLAGDYPETRFIDTSEGVEVDRMEHEGHGHLHHGADPHIWMSVPRVRKIASNMATALQEAFPERKEYFAANLTAFDRELDSLDAHINRQLKSCSGGQFLIYHPALTYFAEDHHLVQVPIEQEGKEPTSQYMRSLIDRARADSITAILIRRQFNQQEARTIEREIGGRLTVIDPLDENWMEQMRFIADELKTALTK